MRKTLHVHSIHSEIAAIDSGQRRVRCHRNQLSDLVPGQIADCERGPAQFRTMALLPDDLLEVSRNARLDGPRRRHSGNASRVAGIVAPPWDKMHLRTILII